MWSVDIYYTQCELKTSLTFYTRRIWWTFICKNAVSSCWHNTDQVLHIHSFFKKNHHRHDFHRSASTGGQTVLTFGPQQQVLCQRWQCWAESHQYITVSLSTLAHDNAANAQTVVEIISPPSGNTATWDQTQDRGQWEQTSAEQNKGNDQNLVEVHVQFSTIHRVE